MSRDDVIRMAKKAGFVCDEADFVFQKPGRVGIQLELERFANLVRADALANIDPSKMMSYQEGFEAGRFAEREACAKVCDEMEEKAEEYGTECCKWPTPSDCAFAIRARGDK
jgi:hypothetical protein